MNENIQKKMDELKSIIEKSENVQIFKIPMTPQLDLTQLTQKIEQLEKDNKNMKYRLNRIERWIESMPEYWNWGSPPEF